MPPAKPPQYQVDACVVSFNTKALTLTTLTQLRASVQVPTNIMVWDNGSTDGSVEALAEFSRRNPITTILSPENLGYGAALNRAFAMGRAPYLLVLNSDLQFPQVGWLGKLVTYLEENLDVGVVGPLLLDEEDRIGGAGVMGSTSTRKIRWWREPYEKHRGKLQSPKECISVCGACMLMRRTAFLDCDGFDENTQRRNGQGFNENFFFYYEETFSHRLMRVYGWRIMFNPVVKVIHLWNKSPNPENIKNKHFQKGDAYFNHVWGDGVRITDE